MYEGFIQAEINQGQSVTVELTPAEALVLFELLYRWQETDAASVPLEHQAEYRVLSHILGTLESTLAEPFMPEYQHWLDRAREMLSLAPPYG